MINTHFIGVYVSKDEKSKEKMKRDNFNELYFVPADVERRKREAEAKEAEERAYFKEAIQFINDRQAKQSLLEKDPQDEELLDKVETKTKEMEGKKE